MKPPTSATTLTGRAVRLAEPAASIAQATAQLVDLRRRTLREHLGARRSTFRNLAGQAFGGSTRRMSGERSVESLRRQDLRFRIHGAEEHEGRHDQGRQLHEGPSLEIRQTLNLKSSTSPSATTYSFPSIR